MQVLGKQFDPELHDPDDMKYPPTTVVVILQAGYYYNGSILRYVSVDVAN